MGKDNSGAKGWVKLDDNIVTQLREIMNRVSGGELKKSGLSTRELSNAAQNKVVVPRNHEALLALLSEHTPQPTS